MWQTILAGNAWHGELVNRKKDGTLYTEEMTITPVRSEEGEISHFLAIKNDITQLKEQVRHQEAIATLSTALRSADTTHEMTQILLDIARSVFGATGLGLALHGSDSDGTEVILGKGLGEAWVGKRPQKKGKTGDLTRRTAEPVVWNSVTNPPEWLGEEEGRKTPWIVSVPLVSKARVVGALILGREQAFHDSEKRILVSLAEIFANAIRRAEQYEKTQKSLRRLESLRRIDLAISSTVELNMTLKVVLDQVTSQLEVDAAAVWILDEGQQTLRLSGETGLLNSGFPVTEIQQGDPASGKWPRPAR